jgi:hypothetical protein
MRMLVICRGRGWIADDNIKPGPDSSSYPAHRTALIQQHRTYVITGTVIMAVCLQL